LSVSYSMPGGACKQCAMFTEPVQLADLTYMKGGE
jgi:hypothetical protein